MWQLRGWRTRSPSVIGPSRSNSRARGHAAQELDAVDASRLCRVIEAVMAALCVRFRTASKSSHR
jgi:hypothetical protein